MKRLIAALCSLAIVTMPFPTAHAGGNTVQEGFVLLLTVNTTDDHNDSSCDSTDCTLREAMFAANDVPTDDIINFSVTGVINLVAPLPVISDGITIEGPGPTMLTLRRDPVWGAFRIFEVTAPDTVTISGLTISNGKVFDDGGGGILINSTGTVNVTNATISDNDGGLSSGGGVRNRSSGTLSVTNCVISGNTVLGGLGLGAGIGNTGAGRVNVIDSTIIGNNRGAGGGIGNGDTGIVVITGSTISGNSPDSLGGGIFNSGGTVSVSFSNIIDNNTGFSGGGIQNESGTLYVSSTTIGGNRAGHVGGGILNGGIANIADSTINGNIADDEAAGVLNSTGTLNVTNSTISNNRLRNFGSGGGISNRSGMVNVTNSTISSNTIIRGDGGGIRNGSTGTLNVKSSIIALNRILSPQGSHHPDVSGPFISHGYNLIGKTDGSTGFTAPTDLTGTIASPLDPRFDPNGLQDNGGETHTIALLSDSPAIDKGSADGLTGMLTTDQRGTGFPRTVDDPAIPPATGGDNTDIGAFEFAPPPLTAGNALLINESCPTTNGAIDPGERVTVNLELINASNAATSSLVATLQTSGGVLAPSAPQNYGAIAANSSVARDFSFTAEGSLTSGQTITATLQLQDEATNLGTVSFTFTAGPTPCAFVRLVVTSSLNRADASTVVGAITVQNIGSLPANDVTLTTAKLGTTSGTPLPQGLGTLAPGASASVIVNFNNSTSGSPSMLAAGGTYAGGTFSGTKRVTIP